mgnify:CR=1 FL=1
MRKKSQGELTLKRDPAATKSTTPAVRPARLNDERNGAAFWADCGREQTNQ